MYSLQRDLQGPGVLERVEQLKQGLLAKVRALGRELPVNTLDQLIHQLGGPECVAEVSLVALDSSEGPVHQPLGVQPGCRGS